MKSFSVLINAFISLRAVPSLAFSPSAKIPRPRRATVLRMADGKVGVFFGTSTGSTESAAEMIVDEFGGEATGPIEIDSIQGRVADEFAKYDALVVGTPTWNTGADTERSGTGWDEIYYSEMQELKNVSGKKVAVFGLGDSVSYSENYADASGELHDVFEALGCKMMGYTSQEGYEHEASKAIRGDRFCGLLLDAVNQEDLTEGRVQNWVKQLIEEGILEGGGGGEEAPAAAASSPDVPSESLVVEASPATPISVTDSSFEAVAELEKENARLRKLLEENVQLLDRSIGGGNGGGYDPHYNEKTGVTMWTSSDGRSCYYTAMTP